MTDIGHGAGGSDVEGEEVDRLVLMGLRAPLDGRNAARLDALVSTSPLLSARAERLAETWMMSGLLTPDKIEVSAAQPARRALIAAALVAAVATPAALWLGRRSPVQSLDAPGDGPLHATLADGTRVVLSRGGRMEARFDRRRRNVRLWAGEAFYAVAKDAARPFQVLVGDHTLTVLGTQFNVDPGSAGLRVDLVEGSLQVARNGDPNSAVVLKPGQRYWADHRPLVVDTDVDAAVAWTAGRLLFDDATLADVSAKIDRQTGRTLVFAEPRLARLRFSGVLRLDRPEDWRVGLEAVLPVRLSSVPGGYRVDRR